MSKSRRSRVGSTPPLEDVHTIAEVKETNDGTSDNVIGTERVCDDSKEGGRPTKSSKKLYRIKEVTDKLLLNPTGNLTKTSLKFPVFKNNDLYEGDSVRPFVFRVVGLASGCEVGLYGDKEYRFNNPRHLIKLVGGNTKNVLRIIREVWSINVKKHVFTT